MKHLLVLFLLFLAVTLHGQQDAKIDKAVDVFNSGKLDKGISMMEKINEKTPSEVTWSVLVKMYYFRYEYAKEISTYNLAALVGEGMGVKMKKRKYTSPTVCFLDLVTISREAGLYSRSTQASQFLRNYFVDYDPDTTVSEVARDEFSEAEKYFNEKDFQEAKKHYLRAYKKDRDFYKAIIYIGDSYWYLEQMDSAVFYFKKGIKMHPDLLEPRKYLVDALAFQKKDSAAMKECIRAISIYPDESMFIKYGDLVERNNKKFDKHWVRRGCEINRVGFESKSAKDPVWKRYQEAKNEISQYCNESGIIVKPNSLTKSKYMEVYSWEKMLEAPGPLPEGFEFAREMKEKGMLDCYVFLSEFHFDLYDQFSDFVKENKDRVSSYLEEFLVE